MESDFPKSQTAMISSLDVIEKTGMSRSSLNNYIKLGILPKPVVLSTKDNANIRATKLGYFPDDVLVKIERVREMKKRGALMPEIVRQLSRPRNAQIKSEYGTPNMAHSQEIPDTMKKNAKSERRNGDISSHLYVPSPVSFCILSARIQEAGRLMAVLALEDYMDLIDQLWKILEEIVPTYRGLYGNCLADHFNLVFLEDEESASHVSHAMNFAFDLKNRFQALCWQAKYLNKGMRDIHINIGIKDEYDYLLELPARLQRFIPFNSDSLNFVNRLSLIAKDGATWVTKTVVQKLSVEQRRIYRFGIRVPETPSTGIIIENRFCPAGDLIASESGVLENSPSFATLSVTEVIAKIEPNG